MSEIYECVSPETRRLCELAVDIASRRRRGSYRDIAAANVRLLQEHLRYMHDATRRKRAKRTISSLQN